MPSADSQHDQSSAAALPVTSATWLLPYLAGWSVFLFVECDPASGSFGRSTPVEWFFRADLDALVYLALLIAAPFAWWFGRNGFRIGRIAARLARGGGERLGRLERLTGGPRWQPVWFSILIAGVSLAASAIVATNFDDLPPAYHDEYSYLFQAETFLAGRVWFPSHEGARLFDQMHVLNEGRFASRYFPGTGSWMAPFVAAGHPYWGH